MKVKVFISYAKEDYAIAKKLFDDLKKHDLNPWLDKEFLLPVQDWKQIITNTIKECSHFITLISSHSISKQGYVQKEQKTALEVLEEMPPDKIFMIPIRLDESKPIDEKLKRLHWIKFDFYRNYEKILEQIISALQPDEKKIHIASEPKHYLGIDIGRDKIACCIIDYSKFDKGDYWKISKEIKTPETENILDLFFEINQLINEVFKKFYDELKDDNCLIRGIGFGLPGQIDPKRGIFLRSPGFNLLYELSLEKFKEILNQNDIIKQIKVRRKNETDKNILIAMDNDVRCATRYLWKKNELTDAICIFSGIGLGSGIILDKRLRYGSNFTAGEIGHTTISGCFKSQDFFPECFKNIIKDERCACEKEGYHMEMFVTRDGMLRIAKNLQLDAYQKLKDDYQDKINTKEYRDLLNEKGGDFNKFQDFHFDNEGELTTYFLSLAYYAGDTYVYKVVKYFIEYLAVGIANYINIINPTDIHLGGGMIRGFFKNRIVPIGKTGKGKQSKELLRQRIKLYALNASINPFPNISIITEPNITAQGAAMIFEDYSYSNYISDRNNL